MGFSEQDVASYIAFVGILSVLAQVSKKLSSSIHTLSLSMHSVV